MTRSMMKGLLAGLLAGLAFGSNAATSTSWEEVKAYTHEKKTEAVAYGRKLMAETDRKLDELAAKARESAGQTKAAHEQNMKELKAKREQAAAKLAEMEKAGSQAWDSTKNAFADAYRDLQQRFDQK